MSTFLGGCLGIQQKFATASLDTASGCGDLSNAVAWINANFDSYYPLNLAWQNNPSGWQYYLAVEFSAPSVTSPDEEISQGSGLIPSGASYPNSSIYAVADGGGAATRVAFLLPDSTVQIVGTWCSDEECTVYWQQACVMTGAPLSCGVSLPGYVFDIPIPDASLCNTAYPYMPEYTVYPNSTYGDLFEDYLWSDFVAACEANPTQCAASTSPGACLSGDPFFGDDPP